MAVYKKGKGLINSVIDRLPFEAHVPGYQYCGPGTKLEKRLLRGDAGINQLDVACKEHDIAYSKYKKDEDRRIADKILSSKAWKRVLSKDASVGERATALAVTTAMKAKIGISKLGKGFPKIVQNPIQTKRIKKKNCKKIRNKKKMKCCTFKKLVNNTTKSLKNANPITHTDIFNTAMIAATKHVNDKNGRISKPPRVIPIPKTGGVLPLVPIFAGLSALGSLLGGGAAVVRAVNATHEAKKEMNEKRRHNKKMEEIAIGSGLYLKPYKKGYGLYLKPYPTSKNH